MRKGTTETPVPATRNGKEPVPSHNLQENSQARFCQLDTTVARRNRPVKSRRGLRQARRGRGKRRPAQARRIHHAKGSLEEARIDRKEIPADAQGIKGMSCRSPPLPKEGRTGDHPYLCMNHPQQRKTAVASPKAREERGHPQKCLQLRSGQQWEEEIPLEPS